MTAPELIALLKSRPVACGRLGVKMRKYSADAHAGPILFDTYPDEDAVYFHNWLTKAATRWCDERGIDTQISRLGNWYATTGREEEEITLADGHPTRLHALLAAIEAAEETTT